MTVAYTLLYFHSSIKQQQFTTAAGRGSQGVSFTLVTSNYCSTISKKRTIYMRACNCKHATKDCQAETANQVLAAYQWIAFPQQSIPTSDGTVIECEPQLYLS
jgi:hypothetical protein